VAEPQHQDAADGVGRSNWRREMDEFDRRWQVGRLRSVWSVGEAAYRAIG
jgi:hypothetical protein